MDVVFLTWFSNKRNTRVGFLLQVIARKVHFFPYISTIHAKESPSRVIRLIKKILHPLRLVVYPIIYRVSYILGCCLGFLNHQ